MAPTSLNKDDFIIFSLVAHKKRRNVSEDESANIKNTIVENHSSNTGNILQSVLLRDKMKLALEPKTLVVIPPSPNLTVLHGAALLGLEPDIIKSRRSMLTYGVGVLARFDATSHLSGAKIVIKNDQKWCCDVFDPFVIINQPVGLFEKITRRYRPVTQNQHFCLLHIYCTDQEQATFVTEPHVHICGTINLELEPIKLDGKVNPAIQELIKREISVEMFFGETEIKVINDACKE